MTSLTGLTDDELIHSLKALAGNERHVLVLVLNHLSEFEKRKIAEGRSYSSLFDYCVKELRYAQGEAFRRIRAARAADKFRILYPLIQRGTLNLTAVALLEPHLKWVNYRALIRASMGKSVREVEALVAGLSPVPAAPAERIRFLAVAAPAPPAEVADLFSPFTGAVTAGSPAALPSEPPSIPRHDEASAKSTAPRPILAVALRRVEFTFTSDEALLRDVERVKELSRHKWPGGRYEDVFTGAVKALLDKIDPDRRMRRKERARKLAAGARGRNIAQAVKDVVWRRDEGRCVYRVPDGRACGARAGLEYDHVQPWALGGPSSAENIRLLCRTHNDLEARRVFGGAVIDAAAARRRGALRSGVKI